MRKRREKEEEEEKEEERKRVRSKERKRKVSTRTRVDCGPSPVWPCLPFSSTLAVLTTQRPVPRFRVTCCGTVFQVPPQGDTWLSVHTKLTLNKFHYTLYKKSQVHSSSHQLPSAKRKTLPSPLLRGTSMGRRGRRRNSFIPIWPAMSMHKAIMVSRGISVTPNGPGRCEEGMAGSSSGPSAPSEPSLSPPGVYSPESPLSSCSRSRTF